MAAIASLRSSASAPAISTPVGPAPTTTIARSSLVFDAAACSRLVKISSRSFSACCPGVDRPGVLLGALGAEVVGRRAGGDDQVVVVHGAAVVEGDQLLGGVDAGDLALPEADVLLRHPGGAQEERHVTGVQAGGGHLVQQRLERVVGVPVDQGDPDLRLAQRADRRQHGEPRPETITTCAGFGHCATAPALSPSASARSHLVKRPRTPNRYPVWRQSSAFRPPGCGAPYTR